MNDCCAPISAAQSWIDWIHAGPANPYELIANAQLGGVAGAFVNSANYGTGYTGVSTVVLKAGAIPVVTALETDNLYRVAEAAQWNFQHLTANQSAALAPP